MKVVKSGSEKSLIKATLFEGLVQKLQIEEDVVLELERNKSRRRNLYKSIISIYAFLRYEYGMVHRDLTIEEFEVTETRLLSIAKNSVKEYKARWYNRLLNRGSPWFHFLQHKCFSYRKTPFGSWDSYIPFNSYEYDFFSVEHAWPPSGSSERWDYQYVPPNIKDLLEQLFEKRYKNSKDSPS